MQQAQQPVQAQPAAVQAKPAVQATQKPTAAKLGQPQPVTQPGQAQTGQPVKKKPKRWWIWVIVAAILIGGGVLIYFQFLR